jgi:hypothetical protein
MVVGIVIIAAFDRLLFLGIVNIKRFDGLEGLND